MGALDWILTLFVIAGGLPLLAGCYQFALSGLHRFRKRSDGELEHEPNVAVLVPAWNEAFVVARTIDTLVGRYGAWFSELANTVLRQPGIQVAKRLVR